MIPAPSWSPSALTRVSANPSLSNMTVSFPCCRYTVAICILSTPTMKASDIGAMMRRRDLGVRRSHAHRGDRVRIGHAGVCDTAATDMTVPHPRHAVVRAASERAIRLRKALMESVVVDRVLPISLNRYACQPCLVHVLLQVKALRQLLIGRRYLGTSDNTAMALASFAMTSNTSAIKRKRTSILLEQGQLCLPSAAVRTTQSRGRASKLCTGVQALTRHGR